MYRRTDMEQSRAHWFRNAEEAHWAAESRPRAPAPDISNRHRELSHRGIFRWKPASVHDTAGISTRRSRARANIYVSCSCSHVNNAYVQFLMGCFVRSSLVFKHYYNVTVERTHGVCSVHLTIEWMDTRNCYTIATCVLVFFPLFSPYLPIRTCVTTYMITKSWFQSDNAGSGVADAAIDDFYNNKLIYKSR